MEPRLSANNFLTIHGKLTIVGREPDGDSIRFIPNDFRTLLHLPNASRLRPASDGSLQLRIDGIDAPETHFLGQAQPQGVSARTAFLNYVGFSNVVFDAAGSVTASTPSQIPATNFVSLLDPYGRPVSYLIAGRTVSQKEGTMGTLDDQMLDQTVNMQMLLSGAAYVTIYSSTPAAQREYLFAKAKLAQEKGVGIWDADKTSRFELTSHDSIGPDSQNLILPKLFRRATSYLDAVAGGTAVGFTEWLKSTIADEHHSQDDYVIRADGSTVRLDTLIEHTGNIITTQLDLLSDVFIEQ